MVQYLTMTRIPMSLFTVMVCVLTFQSSSAYPIFTSRVDKPTPIRYTFRVERLEFGGSESDNEECPEEEYSSDGDEQEEEETTTEYDEENFSTEEEYSGIDDDQDEEETTPDYYEENSSTEEESSGIDENQEEEETTPDYYEENSSTEEENSGIDENQEEEETTSDYYEENSSTEEENSGIDENQEEEETTPDYYEENSSTEEEYPGLDENQEEDETYPENEETPIIDYPGIKGDVELIPRVTSTEDSYDEYSYEEDYNYEEDQEEGVRSTEQEIISLRSVNKRHSQRQQALDGLTRDINHHPTLMRTMRRRAVAAHAHIPVAERPLSPKHHHPKGRHNHQGHMQL